ncbi:MAG: YdcF family protein [Pseudomonadota bacterium]|nr:YdcF family protein [Pseudomonadota bacterium]
MTGIVLATLLLLALLAGWRGRRWLARGLAVLALSWLLAAGCGPLPQWLLAGLQGPYAVRPAIGWAPRNVIVLLGAGTTLVGRGAVEPSFFANGRIVRTVALYRDCKAAGRACRVLVSGGDARHHGAAEATVYAKLLRRLGVPAQDLQLETRSMNTWQNAWFSRPLLREDGAQKVLLVSSALHLRRSLLYFAHFGIRPTPVRGDWLAPVWSFVPLGWNLALTDAACHEYVGIARYRVYNALGWNTPRMAPL